MKIDVDQQHYPTFKIENVPVTRYLNTSRYRYAFGQMKAGQSFFFIPADVSELQRMRAAASQYAKRNGIILSIVKDGKGYRCGRVK